MLSKNELKFVRSLSNGKYRKQHGKFIAEGSKIIREFAREGWDFNRIFSLDDSIFGEFDLPVTEISSKELKQISQLRNPQDALAVISLPEYKKVAISGDAYSIACDKVQDPGNFGTIIRIADWFGIRQIFYNEGCADPFNPKVVQASMGSLARTQCVLADLHELMDNQSVNWMVSTLEGTSIYEARLPESGVILFGNESMGVSPELVKKAGYNLKIPGSGKAESLNVSVAAGIICSELFRTGN